MTAPPRVRLDQLPSGSTTVNVDDTCTTCGFQSGPKAFSYESNGDGGVVMICPKCGTAQPTGRYFQDKSIGVRLPNLSLWSALVTSPPRRNGDNNSCS
jgi:hypothetical protein